MTSPTVAMPPAPAAPVLLPADAPPTEDITAVPDAPVVVPRHG